MRAALRFMVVTSLTLAVGAGCEGKTGSEGSDADSGTSGVPPIETEGPATATASDSTAATSVAEGSASSDATDSADSASSDGADTTEGTTTGNDPTNPVDCGGNVYACGDGMDNDGDGFVDLVDPECTGPCDDDESSFQTGIPGDNMDCKQDCFFDGNSGQGDDGCNWDLRCDPENPGEFVGCAYTGGNNCDNQPPQDEGCLEFCEPYVPPGCDCFGCCTVQTPKGPVDIFLNSHPDCSLDNLDACTPCTSQIDDCGNSCEPVECEICFGETEPPEGCGGNECPGGGDPCDPDQNDCPTDYFCYLGCCYPPPPG